MSGWYNHKYEYAAYHTTGNWGLVAMSEHMERTEVSIHLPPPRAWKEPERWLDLATNLPLKDIEKITLPVDDRGIIKADEAVSLVKERLFDEDYVWSRDRYHHRSDIHHFYYTKSAYSPEAHGGNILPSQFRETPTLMGRMPRQFHDALHAFTEPLEIPSYEVMGDYRASFLLADRAFKRLIEHAENTKDASRQFYLRRRALLSGRLTPKEPTDQIAQEILRDSFERHFTRYSETVDEMKMLQGEGLIDIEVPSYVYNRLHLVAEKVSPYIVRKCIDYSPMFESQRLQAA